MQDEADHPPQVVAKLIDRAVLTGAHLEAQNPRRKFRDDLLEQFLEEILLVRKIEVKSAPRDARSCDYVRDVGAMISLTRENSLRVAQDLGAAFGTFHGFGAVKHRRLKIGR